MEIPNLKSNVAKTPAPPGNVPGGVGDSQPDLSQEEMRANLQDLMSKIENKYQNFNSQKFATQNKSKEQEGVALREIFDMFESLGIDPSNVEEVRAYLDNVKAKNPELSQKIESVLESVLGDEEPSINMNMNNEETPENI